MSLDFLGRIDTLASVGTIPFNPNAINHKVAPNKIILYICVYIYWNKLRLGGNEDVL